MSIMTIEPITATIPSRTVLPTWRETGAAKLPQQTEAANGQAVVPLAFKSQSAPAVATEAPASAVSEAAADQIQTEPTAFAGASTAAQTISSNTMVQRAGVTNTSSLVDLYTLQNKYYYGTSANTWAKLDGSVDGVQDGVWDRSELEQYAQDYLNATGRTIDVDDLLARYGTNLDPLDPSSDLVIRYNEQNQIYQNDELGISYVKDAIMLAEYQGNAGLGSGKPSGTVNQTALNNFINDFTYGTANKLYAKIDKDGDGLWSLDEMLEYGKAYERATGVKLDIEALFAKYDTDGSGYLKYQEQNSMYRDDALGLSRISDLMKAQESGKGSEGKPGLPDKLQDTSLSDRIKEAMNSLTSSQKYGLATAFGKSMQQSALLDHFTMVNLGINSNRNNGYYGYGYGLGMNSYWNMGTWAMSSMFV